MKKQLSITISCLLLMAGLAFGQNSASFTFTNAGNNSVTVNMNDTFTIDVGGMFNFDSTGYSLWLEAPTASGFASSLSITNRTYLVFTDRTDNGFPKVFSDTAGAQSGYLSDADTVINPQTGTIDQGDLGATGFATAGTYNLGQITFSLAGAAPGTYTLFSTVISPRQSQFTQSGTFQSINTPASPFTVTVVPEPSTWSMLILGGLGTVGLVALRRRRHA